MNMMRVVLVPSLACGVLMVSCLAPPAPAPDLVPADCTPAVQKVMERLEACGVRASDEHVVASGRDFFGDANCRDRLECDLACYEAAPCDVFIHGHPIEQEYVCHGWRERGDCPEWRHEVLQNGAQLAATITEVDQINDTNTILGRERIGVVIHVRVEPDDGEDFVAATLREWVLPIQVPQVQPNEIVMVRYDLNDRTKVVIEQPNLMNVCDELRCQEVSWEPDTLHAAMVTLNECVSDCGGQSHLAPVCGRLRWRNGWIAEQEHCVPRE
jgi:hypothetical protein